MFTAKKGGRLNAVEDWISKLPEDIVHHIMALLETKDATRMSILSKKWRSLWHSFPIWDFDETSLIWDLQEGSELRRERFSNFVDESLRHRLHIFGLQKIRLRLRPVVVNSEIKHLFIDESLQHRLPRVFGLQNMRLLLRPMIVNSKIKDSFISCMDKWISLAIERKVKELDLQFMDDDGIFQIACKAYYNLPQAVFASESIHALRLGGCKLRPSGEMGLSSLKRLCLHYVFVDDLVIQHLLSSCPIIEFMSLKLCQGLVNLEVSGHRALKTLIVESRAQLSKIAIDAPNLETLTLQRKGELSIEIVTTGIINLSIIGVSISEDRLHGIISNQPLLETLNLVSCNGIQRLKVYNRQLKTITLYSCDRLVKADFDRKMVSFLEIINVVACVNLKKLKFCGHKLRRLALCGCRNLIDDVLNASKWSMLKTLILIQCRNFKGLKIENKELERLVLYDCCNLVGAYVDAMNLISFKYIGHGLQFNLMNTSCLLDAELWLYPKTVGTIWLCNLINFLRWFGHAKLLTLVSDSWQNLIIPREIRDNLNPPLYDLEHLKLKKSKPAAGIYEEFLNSLVLRSHLKSLSMSMDFTTGNVQSMDHPPPTKEHSKMSYTELVDSSLWISPHIKTLSIDKRSADLLLKFQCKSIEDEGGCPLSWQQSLKEVKIENFEGTDMEMSLHEFFLSNGEVLEAITASRPPKEIIRHRNTSASFRAFRRSGFPSKCSSRDT
ncbi:putative F-box/FBD/LRR-repeat protein At3g59240 isoform X2 [Macadamia integrifolia]|uniref:putative F-box/FBD/LRR-repeat protein At3g59240 isoform X2 n=1 Tax=Macadamia integrifolia TaxID=60698 RepID=UPI001C528193|nr:putative F-box/FBD/LRR-repeat protein At3g59240 isoform X2 [Macadamia integrifolia]